MQRMKLDVEMLDGTIHKDVTVLLCDVIRHSDVSRRHKWGSVQEDSVRAVAFMAYAAMVRTGLYNGDKGFDEFVNEVAWIEQEDVEAVDPTQAATPVG